MWPDSNENCVVVWLGKETKSSVCLFLSQVDSHRPGKGRHSFNCFLVVVTLVAGRVLLRVGFGCHSVEAFLEVLLKWKLARAFGFREVRQKTGRPSPLFFQCEPLLRNSQAMRPWALCPALRQQWTWRKKAGPQWLWGYKDRLREATGWGNR